jgi:flagellar motor switch protein FliM
MSTSGGLVSYDFRKPGGLPKHLEQRLRDWARGICQFTADRWRSFSQVSLEMRLNRFSVLSMSEAREQLSATALGFPCLLNAPKMTTLFSLARPTALAIVESMLGGQSTELPEDGPLSTVQQSLLEVWFEQLADSTAGAWPLQHAVTAQLGTRDDRPQRTKLFSSDQQMLLCEFSLACQFTPQPLNWLLAWDELDQGPLNGGFLKRQPSQDSRRRIEQSVREVPLQLTVRLGEGELTMSELAALATGDVIVLNQRITEPLTATVDDAPVFWGWPGRLGMRQAYQIAKSV